MTVNILLMLGLLDHIEMQEAGELDFRQVDQLCDALMQMRDGELKQMPPELVHMLPEMEDMGVVPSELAKRLKKLFR